MFMFSSIRSSVPFFSFSVLGVCRAFLLVLKSFNDVSRKFKGCLKFKWCFKDVSKKFFVCLQKVPRVFLTSLKGVSKKFQECFKEVSGKLQGCSRKVSRVIQLTLKGVSSSYNIRESFKGVSRKVPGFVKKD